MNLNIFSWKGHNPQSYLLRSTKQELSTLIASKPSQAQDLKTDVRKN